MRASATTAFRSDRAEIPRQDDELPGLRGPRSVSLAQRPDGRVISATIGDGIAINSDGSADAVVEFQDLSVPAYPTTISHWIPPVTAPLADCQGSARAASAQLHDDGLRALVAFSDGSLSDLDLTDPAAPTVALKTPSAENVSGTTGRLGGRSADREPHARRGVGGRRRRTGMSGSARRATRRRAHSTAPSGCRNDPIPDRGIARTAGGLRRTGLRSLAHRRLAGY